VSFGRIIDWFPVRKRDFSHSCSIETCSGVHSSSHYVGRGGSHRLKWLGLEADNSFQLIKAGSVPPVSHMPTWHEQVQFYFDFAFIIFVSFTYQSFCSIVNIVAGMYKLLLIGMFSWLECKKENGEVNLKPILSSRCYRLCSKLLVPLFNLFLCRINKIPSSR